jgi:hypothetical protein
MRTPQRRVAAWSTPAFFAMTPRCAPLAFLLVAGCETSAPPTPAVTAYSAPAPRHTGAWQQFCEQAWNVPQASALVAARGADGWELVAMYNGVLCYKRPAVPAPAPQRPSAPATGGEPLVPILRDPGF